MTMRREGKGPPSRDLLVCFPTRAHLTLMPNRVCSPARHSEARRQLHHHHNRLRKSMRGGGGGGSGGGGHASPYIWSKTKQTSSDNLSEPTSPKVTCAGQIKVRPRAGSCKNWQTVMEEIERLHNDRKKKSTWMEALGLKKDVMHFLTCLRRLKFDFQCFGTFSHVDITSEDEDDDNNNKETSRDQDHHDHDHDHDDDEEVSSRTVFSKWFMVLQENQDCGELEKDEKCLESKETEAPPCLPPPNALMLMRCRSAPTKSWLEERQDDEDENEHHDNNDDDGKEHDDNDEHEDDNIKGKEKKRSSLMELMKNEGDFYKISSDIAKETRVIGGINKDPFSRSRSWKR